MWYILDEEHRAIPATADEWTAWRYRDGEDEFSWDNDPARVMRNEIKVGDDTYIISTVFLGLDHNHRGGHPILYETLVTGPKDYEHMERYHTWDDAELGHMSIVEMLLRHLYYGDKLER